MSRDVRIKIMSTPGFRALQVPATLVVSVAGFLTRAAEPSWAVLDPAMAKGKHDTEDEGRTIRLPSPLPEKTWAIRDSHKAGCGCGCGSSPSVGCQIVTFLLPDEY